MRKVVRKQVEQEEEKRGDIRGRGREEEERRGGNIRGNKLNRKRK